MAAAARLISQPIPYGDKQLQEVAPKDNPNYDKPFVEKVVEYLDSAKGQFRFYQLGGKALTAYVKALKYLEKVPSASVKGCESLLNTIWQGGAIVLIIPSTWEAWKALSLFKREIKPRELLQSPKQRDLLFSTAQKVGYAGALWGYGACSTAYAIGDEKLGEDIKNAADHIDAFENGSSALKEWNQRAELLNAAKALRGQHADDPDSIKVAEHLEQSATAKTIKIAKNFFSMAGLAFSYIIAASLFASAPVVAAVVSIGSTILAVADHFYGETREHKVVDPFKVEIDKRTGADISVFRYTTPQGA